MLKALRARLVFSIPKRRDVLVFDGESEKLVAPLLENHTFEVLRVRHENFNVPVLLAAVIRSMLRGGAVTKRYFEIYTELVSPSRLITSIDTSTTFYELALANPEVTSVVIQNGRRSNFFQSLGDGAYRADYAFVMNESIGNMYSRKFGATALAVGSIRNNQVALTPDFSQREISFISTWTDPSHEIRIDLNSDPIPWEVFHSEDVSLISHLAEWARERDFRVKVIGCSISSADAEFAYFSDLLDSVSPQWEFVRRSAELSSYAELATATVAVSIDSTLASEAIVRGCKVLICNSRAELLGREDLSLGWPSLIPSEGLFWVSSSKEVGRKLEEIIDIPQFQWAELVDSMRPSEWLMASDQGNAKSIRLLSTLIAKAENPWKITS